MGTRFPKSLAPMSGSVLRRIMIAELSSGWTVGIKSSLSIMNTVIRRKLIGKVKLEVIFEFKAKVSFINISGNKRLLMADKFTFAQTTPGHWYCSKKSKGCKARIFLNKDESEVVLFNNNHEHDPPIYKKVKVYQRSQGEWEGRFEWRRVQRQVMSDKK
ncbi:uncharacterized protein LOC142976491 [Anticarsia gemmatalis]|uniref:uncharacterized protein LOC142976491 n=1 Tax=Anticarsia gemmatalis TaxID=129554 RepID=UPI003F76CDFC